MQTAAIGLCIRTQLFAIDIVLTGQAIDIAQRIAKGARSGDIKNRSIRIRQCKQTEPPHLARPPALVFNELIRITPVDRGSSTCTLSRSVYAEPMP